MRLPELQRILIEGARRQENAASSTARSRFGGRRLLIVAIAILLLGGSAAGAVITLTHSKPLSGTLARGPSLPGPSHYRVSVFPYMSVGWSGWCTSAVFDSRGRRAATDYSCGAVESDGPSIAGGNSFGDQNGEYAYGLVSDRVASVHWNGRIFLPVKGPHLPPRTRAYFLASPTLSSRGSLPTLFDAGRHRLANTAITRGNAVEHLPLLAVKLGSSGSAPCVLRASGVPRLVAISQTVADPVPWPRHQAGAFLACANATFELDGTTIGVAVLVDATNAKRSAPPLPELHRDAIHPSLLTGHELGNIGFPHGLGVFNGGGGQAFNTTTRNQEFTNHDISARRAGPAWLIAEGGTSAQRATLLAHLSTRA